MLNRNVTTAGNVEMAVGQHDNVYVAVVNSEALAGLFRSGNGGATWTALDLPGTFDGGIFVGIHPGRQGSLHLSITADPIDPNVVYLGEIVSPADSPIRSAHAISRDGSSGSMLRCPPGARAPT